MVELKLTLEYYSQLRNYKNFFNSGSKQLIVSPKLISQVNKILCLLESDNLDFEFDDKVSLYELDSILKSLLKLRLNQRHVGTFSGLIDLSRFKSLKALELNNIAINNIQWLDVVNLEFKYLFCTRCSGFFNFPSNLLFSLTSLTIVYCNITYIPPEAFKEAKSLKYLDLSFNRISNADGLISLTALEVLCVNYNSLKYVPELSDKCCSSLVELLLSNNHIQNLRGLEKYLHLKILDLSDNCISNKSTFRSLCYLKNLCSLRITRNPISFHRYYRLYVVQCLGTQTPSSQIILDGILLDETERESLGTHINVPAPENAPDLIKNFQSLPECEKYVIVPKINKKSKCIRDAEIQDSIQPLVRKDLKTPKEDSKLKGSQVILNEEEAAKEDVKLIDTVTVPSNNSREQSLMISSNDNTKLLKRELALKIETLAKNNSDPPSNVNNETVSVLHSDKDYKRKEQRVEVTVHASHNQCDEDNFNHFEWNNSSMDFKSGGAEDTSHSNFLSAKDNIEDNGLPSPKVHLNDQFNESVKSESYNNYDECSRIETKDESDGDSSSGDSWPGNDDIVLGNVSLWPVKKVTSSGMKDIFLVLLELELREINTISLRTIARYPLVFLEQYKVLEEDPVTMEIVFMSLLKNKITRKYIMEYPDSQVLIKKMISVIEFRQENTTPVSSSECSVCSNKTTETEVPLPTSTYSVQVDILSRKNDENNSGTCKYESDVEVISNPSQSSIEVIDDQNRFSDTPTRKRSQEDRRNDVNVSEDASCQPTSTSLLTESSSSSSSASESVITTYEANSVINLPKIYETLVDKESGKDHKPPDLQKLIGNTDRAEGGEQKSGSVKDTAVIYSDTDFTNVDLKVKYFLQQSIFCDINEEVKLYVEAHLWKTGGTDYAASFVFSSANFYILKQLTPFNGSDLSDWFHLQECHSKKSINQIFPLICNQGVGLQISSINYFILLYNETSVECLLSALKGLDLKVSILSPKSSSKVEMNLQNLISSSHFLKEVRDTKVMHFAICSTLEIFKNNLSQDFMRLNGFVITERKLFILLGDLGWIINPTMIPVVHHSQEFDALTKLADEGLYIQLHFLDQIEGVEEVWRLKCGNEKQVLSLVKTIQSCGDILKDNA